MSADNPGVLELTEENFAPSIDDHPFAVVDFWAPWCAPCRAFAPTFAAAAAKHPDVLFAKVNTEDQQAIGANNWPFAGAISIVFMLAVLVVIYALNRVGRMNKAYADG